MKDGTIFGRRNEVVISTDLWKPPRCAHYEKVGDFLADFSRNATAFQRFFIARVLDLDAQRLSVKQFQPDRAGRAFGNKLAGKDVAAIVGQHCDSLARIRSCVNANLAALAELIKRQPGGFEKFKKEAVKNIKALIDAYERAGSSSSTAASIPDSASPRTASLLRGSFHQSSITQSVPEINSSVASLGAAPYRLIEPRVQHTITLLTSRTPVTSSDATKWQEGKARREGLALIRENLDRLPDVIREQLVELLAREIPEAVKWHMQPSTEGFRLVRSGQDKPTLVGEKLLAHAGQILLTLSPETYCAVLQTSCRLFVKSRELVTAKKMNISPIALSKFEHFAILADSSEVSSLSPEQRDAIVEYLKTIWSYDGNCKARPADKSVADEVKKVFETIARVLDRQLELAFQREY